MQVTSLLTRNKTTHEPDDSTAETFRRLRHCALGALFLSSSYITEWLQPSNSSIAAAIACLGAAILAWPILYTSLKDLARGSVSINELVSVAVLASLCTGDYRTAGAVSFFMLLGEIIESRTAAGARQSIESLIRLTPTRARRLLPDGSEQDIATKDLRPGDKIRIRPGDNIPADGKILEGQSTLNQSSITGESLPVDRSAGDEVFAGTINLTGAPLIEVTRAGSDTTLGKVRELILAAEESKLPIMRLMDRYMGYYTPFVLTLAAGIWLFSHDLNRVISVLVVACPCAFVLATPSAMVAALSAAARLGILIKNISDLEIASRITTFIFDKTGTLTLGKLVISRIHPLQNIRPSELLQIAASAESLSQHPAAKAIVQLAHETRIPLLTPTQFHESAGRGVHANLGDSNVVVGRAQWLIDQGVPNDFLPSVDLQETEGYSLIFVASQGRCIGWFGLQDQVRPEASTALSELTRNGAVTVHMVTGDRRPVAERIASITGCTQVTADCLPHDKVRVVTDAKSKGHLVAVIGDGVNDAPALASGHISIAMGAAGSDVAIHSASIALMNSDLRRIPFLVILSRRSRSVIHQNFLIGLLFIVGGLSLAALGLLNPIIAALMHNAGSILVVFNSARLVREGENLDASPTDPTHSALASPAYQPVAQNT